MCVVTIETFFCIHECFGKKSLLCDYLAYMVSIALWAPRGRDLCLRGESERGSAGKAKALAS